MRVNVQGGTGAGQRMHHIVGSKQPWTCVHGHPNARYAATCLTAGCRERRPKP